MFEPRTSQSVSAPRQAETLLAYAHGLTTALTMQRIVVALALAASVQAFAPPRIVATTPAAKSVLPLRSDSALHSTVAEETFEQ